jgi:HlyD family secretion protein
MVCCFLAVQLSAQTSLSTPSSSRVVRFHGLVEPVRSYTVTAPRLTGAGPGQVLNQLIIVRLVPAGTLVNKGDLLVEFDRTAQLKSARDREAEHHDAVEQMNRRRGEQIASRALRESQLKQAENDVAIAKLGIVGNDDVAAIMAEKNVQALQEASARFAQLQKTVSLRQRVETADMRILEIQRERAKNAWEHATRNAGKMRIAAPQDGLVVLRSVFRNGSMTEVREGEEVRAGIPILEVVDPSAMRVRASVNQADVEGLAPGQRATITLDSYPSRQFEARLEQLSPIARTSTMSSRVRTFVAIFGIEGSDPHLLPDLAAAVEMAR